MILDKISFIFSLKAGNSQNRFHSVTLTRSSFWPLNRLVICHKVMTSEGKSSLSRFFIPLNVGGRRVTRRSTGKDMRVPKMNTNKGRCSIQFRGPNHWNKLNPNLKEIEKFRSFKTEYSKMLKSNFENHPT